MPRARGKSKEEVAREILSYFLRNPQATDSLMGIARWRLLEEAVHRSVTETESGLHWLIEHGYLCELSVEGSEPLFQLDSTRLKEAQLFLEAAGSGRNKKMKRTDYG